MNLHLSLTSKITIIDISIFAIEPIFVKYYSAFTLLRIKDFYLFHIQKSGKIIYINFIYFKYNNMRRLIKKRKQLNDKSK